MARMKRLHLFLALIVFLFFLFLLRVTHLSRRHQDLIATFMSSSVDEVDAILLDIDKSGLVKHLSFATPFLSNRWPESLEKWNFSSCDGEAQLCAITDYPYAADALIFHAEDLDPWLRVWSKYRRPSVPWVLFTESTPLQVTLTTSDVGSFNYSATFRASSTFPLPMGYKVEPLTEHGTGLNPEIVAKAEAANWRLTNARYHKLVRRVEAKEPIVMAFVNGPCDPSQNPALRFVQSFRSHQPVDIFGQCGQECSVKKGCDWTALEERYAYVMIVAQLSCTRQFQKPLDLLAGTSIVPVIIGGGRDLAYSEALPRGSFVSSRNFNNVRALSQHLMTVVKNRRAFQGLYDWSVQAKIVPALRGEFLCDLCKHLHAKTIKRSLDPNFWIAHKDCAEKMEIFSGVEDDDNV